MPVFTSQDVLGNFDLLSVLFPFFHIIEIFPLILVNSSIYAYIKNEEKSLFVIKNIIKYDYKNIFGLVPNHKNSLKLIPNKQVEIFL